MKLNKEKILKAGKIASEVREFARSFIKKGMLLIEISNKMEEKIHHLGGKPAFPTCLSIDNIAAHATPKHDSAEIAKGILKVDFGVHMDGWIADTAFTVDLENSEEYKKRRSFFYKKFKEDRQFRKEVFNIVRSTISLDFHEFEIEKLSEYVLDELPIVLCSFIYDKTEYSCHPYPVNTKISEFAEKIQNKEIFPEISVELKFKNMVCVQLVIV